MEGVFKEERGCARAGELAQIQAAAGGAAAAHRQPAIMSTLTGSGGGASGRRHLESNMAAALVLQSAAEYKRWLLTYVRHLAGGHHSFVTYLGAERVDLSLC